METKRRKDGDFTMEDAFAIQKRNLKEWKAKLNPEVYEALYLFATESNVKVSHPYNVFRGDDMTTFILNYKSKK